MALTLDAVTVALGSQVVLDAISAKFAPGRITAVMGPNGAGKSTLLRAAAGLLPVAGVALEGVAVAELPPRERARRIGYLPQDHVVHWNVTVRDLVALGRAPFRAPFAGESGADRAAIDRALLATDTAALAGRRVLTLSGGERARVLLARVLAGEPDWLLTDEPLASLDPAHQLDLLDRLRAVAGAGAGVVVVLHDLAQAARTADDVLIVDRGRIAVPIGPPAQVLTEATIAAVFGIAARWIDVEGTPMLVPTGSHTGVRPLASPA